MNSSSTRRREAGPLLVQRHEQRRRAGTPCGTSPSRGISSGGPRNSRFHFSQLRFSPSQQSTFGFAIAREIGRLRETSTWPLLPSRREWLRPSVRRARRACRRRRAGEAARASCRTRRQPHAAADREQPARRRRRRHRRPLGMDCKYALTPGLTFTATVESRFRSGRSRSRLSSTCRRSRRSSSTSGGRFRRRVRQLPFRRGLLRRVQQPVLLATNRPVTAGHGIAPVGRRHLHATRRRNRRFSAQPSRPAGSGSYSIGVDARRDAGGIRRRVDARVCAPSRPWSRRPTTPSLA